MNYYTAIITFIAIGLTIFTWLSVRKRKRDITEDEKYIQELHDDNIKLDNENKRLDRINNARKDEIEKLLKKSGAIKTDADMRAFMDSIKKQDTDTD